MYFVTDTRPGEPELLSAEVAHAELRIVSLDDPSEIYARYPAPPSGWTHQQLVDLDIPASILQDGAEALLGSLWVGSTEC